jgi:hypothetical protein
MPGGVAGAQPIRAVPYADPLIVRLVANLREIATGRARHAGFSIPLTG